LQQIRTSNFRKVVRQHTESEVGSIIWACWKFSFLSSSERILKMCWEFTKLLAWVLFLLLVLEHSVFVCSLHPLSRFIGCWVVNVWT